MRIKSSRHDWSCECPWCYVMLPGISAHRISSPPSAILAEYDFVSNNSVTKIDAPLKAYSLLCYALIDMLWALALTVNMMLCCRSRVDATMLLSVCSVLSWAEVSWVLRTRTYIHGTCTLIGNWISSLQSYRRHTTVYLTLPDPTGRTHTLLLHHKLTYCS